LLPVLAGGDFVGQREGGCRARFRWRLATAWLPSGRHPSFWRRAGRAAGPVLGCCFARGACTRDPATSHRCAGVMIRGRAGRCRSAERAKPTCRELGVFVVGSPFRPV